MEERKYHCLVAGLPELNFGDSAIPFTPVELKGILREELHRDDYYQLQVLLYPFDHENLVMFLGGSDDTGEEGLANFPRRIYRDQAELISGIDSGEDMLPSYMQEVLIRYLDNSPEFDPISCRMDLDTAYAKHIEVVGHRFLKEFKRFEYDLSNLLSFLKAARFDEDSVAFVTGESPFARHLRQLKGGIVSNDHEFDYFDEIISIEKSSGYSVAEVEYDKLRWSMIDQITLFEDFSSDAVLAYFSKLLIADRWAGMSHSKGKRLLMELVDHALSDKLPDNWNRNY